MIRVQRTLKPPVLARNDVRWLSELQAALTDPTATLIRVRRAWNKYHHHEIKSALVAMFHGKCAYCESKIAHVTYGAIEHFWPKGRYVNRTFDWNNLLLSCDICNDAGHKGTQFPLDAHGNPLLIDPTRDVPGLHLWFDWNPVTRLASVYGTDERGREVERLFDLNGIHGRMELIVHRSRYVAKLVRLRHLADAGDTEAKYLLDEACQPNEEYCAFARIHACPRAVS